MRVQRSATHEVLYVILDDNDQVIEVVSGFMRYLSARSLSPNTQAAYAYDLLHFLRFLKEQQLTVQEFTPAHALRFLGNLDSVVFLG